MYLLSEDECDPSLKTQLHAKLTELLDQQSIQTRKIRDLEERIRCNQRRPPQTTTQPERSSNNERENNPDAKWQKVENGRGRPSGPTSTRGRGDQRGRGRGGRGGRNRAPRNKEWDEGDGTFMDDNDYDDYEYYGMHGDD